MQRQPTEKEQKLLKRRSNLDLVAIALLILGLLSLLSCCSPVRKLNKAELLIRNDSTIFNQLGREWANQHREEVCNPFLLRKNK